MRAMAGTTSDPPRHLQVRPAAASVLPGNRTVGANEELERCVHAALETYSNIHRGTGHNSVVSTHLFSGTSHPTWSRTNWPRGAESGCGTVATRTSAGQVSAPYRSLARMADRSGPDPVSKVHRRRASRPRQGEPGDRESRRRCGYVASGVGPDCPATQGPGGQTDGFDASRRPYPAADAGPASDG